MSLRRALVGIRREDPKRIWERRAPLTPDAVYNLISPGRADVEVMSCAKRVFTDAEYEKAGARVVKHLTTPNFILGIKEPPLSHLYAIHKDTTHAPLQTHLMFSHTAKGQEYNLPLLSFFLHNHSPNRPRLIDFELLKNEEGKRTVGFGWFAGAAGVLEAFSAMAQSHLEKGVASPFLYTGRPYTHRSLADFRTNLKTIGVMIQADGVPDALGPFIIGVTGTGNVSQGCLDMLKELPITMVRPEDLESLVRNPDYNRKTVYLVHATPIDYLQRQGGGQYDRADYYAHPELYQSIFHSKIAPYLTLFMNGAGWSPGFPRLMTTVQLHAALAKATELGGFRGTNVADISCDIEGGLEFLSQATTLSSPFYDIPSPPAQALPAVRMMAVDILPTSIPLDASTHFSGALEPYLHDLIAEFGSAQPRQATPLTQALRRATIAQSGKLNTEYAWLKAGVEAPWVDNAKREAQSQLDSDPGTPALAQLAPIAPTKKRVLLLGSGMVAAPAVDYLARVGGAHVVIASNHVEEMRALAKPYAASGNVEYHVVDFSDPRRCAPFIQEADVVISLLPANMHTDIAKLCIDAGKHLVTASYTSDEMKDLDERARKANVLILTECGLDPGLDHLSAMALIDKLRAEKKWIVSFTSFCGGLPAPEDAYGVPLRYKFSWRPQGVLIAALQEAKYILHRQIQRIPGKALLHESFPRIPITPEFELEGLPNRNSLPYAKIYGLGNMRTFIRGTLRYPGYSALLHSFAQLGLLNTQTKIRPADWASFVAQCLVARYDVTDGILPPLPEIIDKEALGPLHEALEWLGLAKTTTTTGQVKKAGMPPLPEGWNSPLDIFAYLLKEKLRYEQGERDMVVLSHEVITRDSTSTETVHTSTLIAYGTDLPDVGFPGARPASAMARTVGLPAAIAAMLVVQGQLGVSAGLVGVHRPTDARVYKPMLEKLNDMGIVMEETTRVVNVKAPLPTPSKYDKRGSRNSNRGMLDAEPDHAQETVEAALVRAHAARGRTLPSIEGYEPGRDLDDDGKWVREDEDEVVKWKDDEKKEKRV